MKKLIALFLIAAASAVGQSSEPSLSPAERSVAEARKLIEKKPSQYAGYNQLAVALSRRARETSDVNFYAQAEDALKKSLELAPQNFEAEKIRIWLLLGSRQGSGPWRVDDTVDHDVGHVHAVLRIFLRQHLCQRAHHHARIVQ